jgi:hypothetical protein
MADYDPLMYAPHAPGAPPPPINLRQQIQINRDCVFRILAGSYYIWMGPGYNYNDIAHEHHKNAINRKIDEWIHNLKQGDNLEQLKQMFNEFKESITISTRQGQFNREPGGWYLFFIRWCSNFDRHIPLSNSGLGSLIEKQAFENSPVTSNAGGANLVIQLIECIINLTSSIISLEQEDRRRGGKKRRKKTKIIQTKKRRRQTKTKKKRRQTYKK